MSFQPSTSNGGLSGTRSDILVTGATGFLGRHLVQQLLTSRTGDVHCLVRAGSVERLHALAARWEGGDRVRPVLGDLTSPSLGVDRQWIAETRGSIRDVFHLAALYDMTAPAHRCTQVNVEGTRQALALAGELGAACFHHTSSVAVAGNHRGLFTENMFDSGQSLPSAYHRSKFEAERLVREQSQVPWRVYRPAVVVGHSRTGEMDKVDGPYYFFPLLKAMRDRLPQYAPVFGVDLGDTNVVPVDFVVAAMDAIASRPGLDGRAFHLVSPVPQPTTEVINTLAVAAGAPRFAVPWDRRVTSLVPGSALVARGVTSLLDNPLVQRALRQTVGRLGVPPEVLAHVSMAPTFSSRCTAQVLATTDITCPPLESYASVLWDWWEQHLDPSTARDAALRRRLQGRTVVVTGASSGIGRATALKVAQAGGVSLLVARGREGLEQTQSEIEQLGGVAHVYTCDLSDMAEVDALTKEIVEDHGSIDVVVNNAGRSIRRSLQLSYDRFHDFERTMQLNYFGAIRLVMGLTPAMAGRGAHVVNISSIGVQTHPPRFSAYVASKAALDAWSRVVSSELLGDGITFTTIRMPLVRTPMIAPTKIYDAFPAISPAQAADLVMAAIKEEPHEINTTLGTLGSLGHSLTPKLVFRILHTAYQVFPDSPAAVKGAASPTEPPMTREQVLLARLMKGIHW
jgi:NAD(P)-dependent dehydrogenase (short-subunit alcohol dehydrogenase family)